MVTSVLLATDNLARLQVVKAAENGKRDMDIAVCCPYPFLATVAEITKGTKVSVGAEDIFTEDK